MDRLTTDNPMSNVSAMLNFAYAKDKRVTLRCLNGGEVDVDLCDYIEKQCRELGFDCCVCAPDVMEGACMECDCVLAVLNIVAIQAAELRARLMIYEDAGPVRPKGEWKNIGGDEWCCSNCGFVASTEGRWEPMMDDFCRGCGADMRKGENG